MSSHHDTPSQKRFSRWPWFWLLLLLWGGSGSYSCALSRSYCLRDTDCPAGSICVVAQCLRAISERTPVDGSNETSLESEPSENILAEQIDPDTPLPDGAVCFEGTSRPCDLSADAMCEKKAENHFICNSTCHRGVQRCTLGQWPAACSVISVVSAEVCDGMDNDCDGKTDEKLSKCLTTLTTLHPPLARTVGLALDYRKKRAFFAFQSKQDLPFFLRQIDLDTTKAANLNIIPEPASLPKSYKDVTSMTLFAPADAKASRILYFAADAGCTLYKAIISDNEPTKVQRMGTGVCRVTSAIPSTTPTPIDQVNFKDITALAVFEGSGKLYILEKSESLIHEYDPATQTLLTVFAKPPSAPLCTYTAFLEPLFLAAPNQAEEQLLLLYQGTAVQCGLFSSLRKGATCQVASYAISEKTGLSTPSAFVPTQPEGNPVDGYYFTQIDAAQAKCAIFFGKANRAVPTAPNVLWEGSCDRKDGILDGANSTATLRQIRAMAWDPKAKELYLLESTELGGALRRFSP